MYLAIYSFRKLTFKDYDNTIEYFVMRAYQINSIIKKP